MCVCMCTCTRWLWWCIYVFEHEPYSTTKKEREKKTKRNLVVIPQRENTLLTPDWVNSRGHTSSCRCAVLKSGISHDLVNLLSLCYGYCSPLVKRDCNRCSKSSKLKKTWQSWVRAPLARLRGPLKFSFTITIPQYLFHETKKHTWLRCHASIIQLSSRAFIAKNKIMHVANMFSKNWPQHFFAKFCHN